MILIAMLLSVAMPAPAPAADSSSLVEADAQAVVRTAAALEPHLQDTWPDGKPGTTRLVGAHWQALQKWAADWLDAHPRASAAAFVQAGARFGDDWSFAAERFGRGDMLVSVARYQIGNAFILGRGADGKYRVRWSTAAPQMRLNRDADDSLVGWRTAILNAPCRCRMIGVSRVGRLPDAADGGARFWIEADYTQEMGATRGTQLSLWSWRNGCARPLLVHNFTLMDQPGPVLRGSILHVASKGEWRSIYACGSCSGRTVDLHFAIEPGGVRALPAISRTPELDVIDRVFALMIAGRPVGALASPAAQVVIRKQLRDALAETDPKLRELVGMVGGWQRWNLRGERWVCLNVDDAGVTAFAFDRKRTRIVAARALAPNTCQGDGTYM